MYVLFFLCYYVSIESSGNMALIKCEECGKEISDKAKTCPNCGFPLNEESKKENKSIEAVTCPECGARIKLDEGQDHGFCNYCGAEVLNKNIKKIKVEGSVELDATDIKLDELDNKYTHICNLLHEFKIIEAKHECEELLSKYPKESVTYLYLLTIEELLPVPQFEKFNDELNYIEERKRHSDFLLDKCLEYAISEEVKDDAIKSHARVMQRYTKVNNSAWGIKCLVATIVFAILTFSFWNEETMVVSIISGIIGLASLLLAIGFFLANKQPTIQNRKDFDKEETIDETKYHSLKESDYDEKTIINDTVKHYIKIRDINKAKEYIMEKFFINSEDSLYLAKKAQKKYSIIIIGGFLGILAAFIIGCYLIEAIFFIHEDQFIGTKWEDSSTEYYNEYDCYIANDFNIFMPTTCYVKTGKQTLEFYANNSVRNTLPQEKQLPNGDIYSSGIEVIQSWNCVNNLLYIKYKEDNDFYIDRYEYNKDAETLTLVGRVKNEKSESITKKVYKKVK